MSKYEDDYLSSSSTDDYEYTLFADPSLLLLLGSANQVLDKLFFNDLDSVVQPSASATSQHDALDKTRHITVAAGIVTSINVNDHPIIILKSGANAVLRKKLIDGPWMMAKVSANDGDIEIQLNGLQFTTEEQA